ncbi:MAG: ribonuclease E/G [Pseudomonadota bacterium]
MGIDHILKYDGLAGRCLMACRRDGAPVRSLWQPVSTPTECVFPGCYISATVRRIAPGQGGSFLEGEGGEELFLAHSYKARPVEGERIEVVCVSSARSDKLARVRKIDGETMPSFETPEDAWMAGLRGDPGPPIIETLDAHMQIDAALEDLLSPTVPLPGGGRLTIAPTRALVAVDVDTSGRNPRGNRAQNAQEINLEAVETLARQIALRDLGGTVVLDCLGPISKARGQALRSAFLDAFSELSHRRVEALIPSKFGLLEIAIAWGRQPFHDQWLDRFGTLQTSAKLWRSMRRLEIEASARPMDRLTLELPNDVFNLFAKHSGSYMQRIEARFGARIDVVPSSGNQTEVTPR